MTTTSFASRASSWIGCILLPVATFAGVVVLGLSMATMVPHTARAHGGCTECVHNVNHWSCGASNRDDVTCHKVSAALCMDLKADCVGSTTGITGGGIGEGMRDYALSTTSL
jgi:hypothetical protein